MQVCDQMHDLAIFTPSPPLPKENIFVAHWIKVWMGPRAAVDSLRTKSRLLPIPLLQSVAVTIPT